MVGLCLEGHNPTMGITRLLYKLRRFGELGLADKWLLLRAVFWLAVARLMLIAMSFERLTKRFSAAGDAASSNPDMASIERVGLAVRAAANNVPWRSDCFPQAIAARALLKSFGILATIHLGVERSGEESLVGHAWLSCGDTIVTGGAELDRYVEVHRL